jgi:hypothetical protein
MMFRTTTRELLLLTLAVGTIVAWSIDHSKLTSELQTTTNKFATVERLLQFTLDTYYKETGKYMEMGEDSLGINYEPTNGTYRR